MKRKDYDSSENVKDPVAILLDFLGSKDEIEKELKKIGEEVERNKKEEGRQKKQKILQRSNSNVKNGYSREFNILNENYDDISTVMNENDTIMNDIKYDLDILEDFEIEKEKEKNKLKRIKIIPKREEGKEILKYAEIDLDNFGEFKIPKRFHAQGLLSIFDIFIERT